MKFGNLREVTGKFVKESVDWLEKEQTGCCSICFATDNTYNYAVCIGWHNLDDGPKEKNYQHWMVAWKIGRQTTNNIMQCDFEVDFDLPYNDDTGDIDDTLETIEIVDGKPVGYRSWADLAAYMRKTARRVWNDWKEVSDDRS